MTPDDIEDALDGEDALKAEADEADADVSWQQVKAELGL